MTEQRLTKQKKSSKREYKSSYWLQTKDGQWVKTNNVKYVRKTFFSSFIISSFQHEDIFALGKNSLTTLWYGGQLAVL
jgi:hypothetical protein